MRSVIGDVNSHVSKTIDAAGICWTYGSGTIIEYYFQTIPVLTMRLVFSYGDFRVRFPSVRHADRWRGIMLRLLRKRDHFQ